MLEQPIWVPKEPFDQIYLESEELFSLDLVS